MEEGLFVSSFFILFFSCLLALSLSLSLGSRARRRRIEKG